MEKAKNDILSIEQHIKEMLSDFVKEHGHCDINLHSQLYYREGIDEKDKRLTKIEVKMNVTI